MPMFGYFSGTKMSKFGYFSGTKMPRPGISAGTKDRPHFCGIQMPFKCRINATEMQKYALSVLM